MTGLACEDVVFTGGASKGMLWPKILADVLGLPVTVPRVKESTALGAAIFAGIGAGVYRDVETAAKHVVGRERTIEPDPKTHDRYRKLYEDWRRLYDAQLAMVEDGLVTPLWRAAGT